MKFEEDFDFETANAQFHKDDIDKELQNKLKLKGTAPTHLSPKGQRQELAKTWRGQMSFFGIYIGSDWHFLMIRRLFFTGSIGFMVEVKCLHGIESVMYHNSCDTALT